MAATDPTPQHTLHTPANSTNKSFDLYATGPFQAFGREHQASLGVSVNDYTSELNLDSANPNGWDRRPLNFYQLQNFPKPSQFYTFYNTFLDAKETAVYGSARLKIAEPLSFVLGGRATWYEEKSKSYNGPANLWTTNPTAKANGEFTPYAGTVLDLNDTFSAYASYTRIFIPRTERDAANECAAAAANRQELRTGPQGRAPGRQAQHQLCRLPHPGSQCAGRRPQRHAVAGRQYAVQVRGGGAQQGF
jgi:outer membrane receptor for ferric coprogen and ferric-rhodotorulic acid